MANPTKHPGETGKSPPATVSRRRFGRDAVLAGGLALSSVSLLTGKEHSAGLGAASPDSLGIESDQAQEVEAKLSNIIRKYGDRLSFAQREHLRRILAYNEKMLASVRAFALQNGDPPASVLRISFSAEATNTETPRSMKNKVSRSLDETQQEPT